MLEAGGADTASAAAMQRRMRDPASRAAALRETAERPDARASWRLAVYAALDGDEAMIRYLTSLASGPASDPKRADVGGIIICGCIRPGLRADPRFKAAMSRLGFP
jgi:hypothetical protein